jgi:predicted glycoside hydrolase/deacetylase ChbG (UPF0249 family)
MTFSDANPVDGLTQAGPGGPVVRLIVNADDLGVSERVNDGIVQAHRSGIVTAASLMASGRGFDHAVQCCRRAPELDVGVHLTLVAEKPLQPKESSLTGDDGRLPPTIGVFLRRCLAGAIRMTDIQAELSAQIERVLDHGLRPTHLDSHQHVHALPGIAQLVLRLSDRYRIPFVRVPVEEPRIDRPLSLHAASRWSGAMALRTSWMLARLSGARTPVGRRLRFLGFTEGGRLTRTRLHRLLRTLRPGRTYELMCHPGFAPDEPDIQRWRYRHEQELRALTSAWIRSEIAARGIRLIGFNHLIPSDFFVRRTDSG